MIESQEGGIHACVKQPSENVTSTAGISIITEAVVNDVGMDRLMDCLKRSQGNSVAAETIALVAN